MNHTSYVIRYSFRSPEKASSIRAALTMVRSALGVRRLFIVRCADGIFLYRDRASMLRDDTGAYAHASVTAEGGK